MNRGRKRGLQDAAGWYFSFRILILLTAQYLLTAHGSALPMATVQSLY